MASYYGRKYGRNTTGHTGSTDALYARADIPKLNPIAQKPFYTIDREIAHVHPQDRSLHVWLSDADAKAVVEKGWGERFVVKFAPSGYVMVYAPRNEDEVKILEKSSRQVLSGLLVLSCEKQRKFSDKTVLGYVSYTYRAPNKNSKRLEIKAGYPTIEYQNHCH
jgi:hypothetical protein